MYFILIEGNSQTSSFRIPENHTVHPTLPLPSPTNLVGLLGAVKGYKYSDAQKYVIDNSIYMGIYGYNHGYARDFWKTEVFINGVPYPVKRDVNFFNKYIIVFGCNIKSELDSIYNSFNNPVYLTVMGTSDDLLKLSKIKIMVEGKDYIEESSNTFENTLLFGDYSQNIKLNLEKYHSKSGEGYIKITPPRRFSLSIVFDFDNDVRIPIKKETITYINSMISFDSNIKSIKIINNSSYNNIYIPIFTLSDNEQGKQNAQYNLF